MTDLTAAQHFDLAYQRDCDAERPADVTEHHYREAIRLDPQNARYRAACICHLLTRGQALEAEKAWDEAAALGSQDYKTLHWPVARLAMHRADLDLAGKVLTEVPQDVLRHDPEWVPVWQLFRLLQQAEREQSVFPSYIPVDDQWPGPHLSPRERLGTPLTNWAAGRVTYAAENVVVRIGMTAFGQSGAVGFGWINVASEKFKSWCRPVFEPQEHAFVELAWYGAADPTQDDPEVRLHPPGKNPWEALPPIFPDPLRYLRRAGWVRT